LPEKSYQIILTAKPYYFKFWPDISLIDVYKNRKRIHTIVVDDPCPTLVAKSLAAKYLSEAFIGDHEAENIKL
jgi:hypothetical protein